MSDLKSTNYINNNTYNVSIKYSFCRKIYISITYNVSIKYYFCRKIYISITYNVSIKYYFCRKIYIYQLPTM